MVFVNQMFLTNLAMLEGSLRHARDLCKHNMVIRQGEPVQIDC